MWRVVLLLLLVLPFGEGEGGGGGVEEEMEEAVWRSKIHSKYFFERNGTEGGRREERERKEGRAAGTLHPELLECHHTRWEDTSGPCLKIAQKAPRALALPNTEAWLLIWR